MPDPIAKPWYEASFGKEYLELYAHRDEAEAHADIKAIVDLISPPRDQPLLDLCCGAGRHLASLVELGFTSLVGLDLSHELLHVAERRLHPSDGCADGKILLVRADMREIPYQNHFAAVLSLFTSFGYFDDDAQNQAVFGAVYRALRPGGTFLIDYLNRDYVVDNLVECDSKELPDRRIDNVRCLTEGCRRVEKTVIVTIADGRQRTFHESVRMYSQAEMIDMLRAEGLVDIWTCGSLNGECFECGSERLILVAKKPEA
ncbi:MAG: class I SAM-dependent methyltransferase [Anaerolineae bacterium]|nr:class I SAM-dependent methyltransferase [Anaerolineae bacterium]